MQRVCVSAHVLRESDGCREGRVISWLHTEPSPGLVARAKDVARKMGKIAKLLDSEGQSER